MGARFFIIKLQNGNDHTDTRTIGYVAESEADAQRDMELANSDFIAENGDDILKPEIVGIREMKSDHPLAGIATIGLLLGEDLSEIWNSLELEDDIHTLTPPENAYLN